MLRLFKLALCVMLFSRLAAGQTLNCNFESYKPLDGLNAKVQGGALEVTWKGERGQQLRADFTIRGGQPVVQELAARKDAGDWGVLGRSLIPEFQVTSGMRRLALAQAGALKKLHGALTPEVIDKNRWNAFWDAPL
ncbi:MAG: hypothetical protein ACRD2G_15015, partial [Terriglobia bacterium]